MRAIRLLTVLGIVLPFACEESPVSMAPPRIPPARAIAAVDSDGRVTTAAGKADTALITAVDPASPDTTPPTIAAASFTPTSVDVTAANAAVDFTLRITDARSGVRAAWIELRSPTGRRNAPSCILRLESGSARDGVWTCRAIFPEFSESGEWSVHGIFLEDAVRNATNITTRDLETAGYRTSFEVASVEDVTPPSLEGFSFSPTAVDVRTASATIDVAFHILDAPAGVEHVFVSFLSPSRRQPGGACLRLTLVSGSARDGTWTCRMTIPRYVERGTWAANSVVLEDHAGNAVGIGEPELRAAGFVTELDVVSDEDLAPPSIAAFSFSPTSVHIATAGATVTATLRVLDAPAGTRTIHVHFVSPSGRHSPICTGLTLSSGSPQDGVWTCRTAISPLAERGVWSVRGIFLEDRAGNAVNASEVDLRSAGFDTTLDVTR